MKEPLIARAVSEGERLPWDVTQTREQSPSNHGRGGMSAEQSSGRFGLFRVIVLPTGRARRTRGTRGVPCVIRGRTLPPRNETMIFESDPNYGFRIGGPPLSTGGAWLSGPRPKPVISPLGEITTRTSSGSPSFVLFAACQYCR